MQLHFFILSTLLFCSSLGRKLPSPITTDAQTCTDLSPNCPVPDPATPVYFPDPSDCHAFCECSNGVAYEKDCNPATLVYDPTAGVCVTDTQYACDTDSSSVKKSIERKIPHGIIKEYDYDEECDASVSAQCPTPDPASPVYLPNPDDNTCSTFCQCSDGTAFLQDCAPGTVYYTTESKCVGPSVYNCTTSGSAPTTTENSVTRFH